jgi:hypothetical protein
VSQRFELPPKLVVIVDLSVERDDSRAILGAHGLGARFRQIEDGEPPVPQDPTIAVHDSNAVRTAMND